MKRAIRIAIMASGSGSNAQALIRKAKSLSNALVEVALVITDQPEAGVIAKAQAEGVKTFVIPRLIGKKEHELEILAALQNARIDWIFLAGYMRLLSADFLKQFASWHGGASQVVNIHPSLLPAYPGVDSIKRAYDDKVTLSGVTLHYVDEGMDTGALIHQEAIARNPGETLHMWSSLFHVIEHRLYCSFLEDVAHAKVPTRYFEEKFL